MLTPDKSTLDNFKLLTFKSDKMIFDRVHLSLNLKLISLVFFLPKK